MVFCLKCVGCLLARINICCTEQSVLHFRFFSQQHFSFDLLVENEESTPTGRGPDDCGSESAIKAKEALIANYSSHSVTN